MIPITAVDVPDANITHQQEEIVRIITPMAVKLVEQTASDQDSEAKAKLATELIVTFLEEIDGQLDLPCSGPYCHICSLCSF